MIPMFQFRQAVTAGTPPTLEGRNEIFGGYDEPWRKTWNAGILSPADLEAALLGNPSIATAYHPAFPEFTQVVRTAYREGTGERDWDSSTESYSDVAEELQTLAGTTMGSWTDITPYDLDLSVGSEVVSDALASGTTRHMVCRAWEIKYLIRWAPPFSSRAKFRVHESADFVPTVIDIEWDGAAGITIDGIQRCFQENISMPVTDAMWIPDPAGSRVLDFQFGVIREVEIVFATPFRAIPLP